MGSKRKGRSAEGGRVPSGNAPADGSVPPSGGGKIARLSGLRPDLALLVAALLVGGTCTTVVLARHRNAGPPEVLSETVTNTSGPSGSGGSGSTGGGTNDASSGDQGGTDGGTEGGTGGGDGGGTGKGDQPDLMVSALNGTTVVVVNAGVGPAGSSVVAVSGTTFPIAGLAPGASDSATFDCREGPLTATADVNGQVAESNEGNNTRTAGPFTCSGTQAKLPDLQVSALTSTSVTVDNSGDAASGSFVTSVSGIDLTFGSIAAGSSATKKMSCRAGLLNATADARGQVDESDETNNSKKAGPFTCPAPDLIVSDVSSTSATIENVGTLGAGKSVVDVEGDRLTVGSLQPGVGTTVTFPCKEGLITATADVTGDIVESNESNNTKTGGPFTCAKPDLVITELTSDLFVVQNLGGADITVDFVVTVSGPADYTIAGLGAGKSNTVHFADCKAGSLTATADSTHKVDESDESNNDRTAGPFVCGEPDLLVTDLTSTSATVKNQGNLDAGAFLLDVSGVGTFDIGGLAAGSSTTIKFACTEGKLTATADIRDQVVESNENNNSTTVDVGVCPKPDLVITDITTLSVTIMNIGDAPAGSSQVKVTSAGTFDVGSLGAGQSVTIDLQGCFEGDLTATADVADQVAESDEGNNVLTKSVGLC